MVALAVSSFLTGCDSQVQEVEGEQINVEATVLFEGQPEFAAAIAADRGSIGTESGFARMSAAPQAYSMFQSEAVEIEPQILYRQRYRGIRFPKRLVEAAGGEVLVVGVRLYDEDGRLLYVTNAEIPGGAAAEESWALLFPELRHPGSRLVEDAQEAPARMMNDPNTTNTGTWTTGITVTADPWVSPFNRQSGMGGLSPCVGPDWYCSEEDGQLLTIDAGVSRPPARPKEPEPCNTGNNLIDSPGFAAGAKIMWEASNPNAMSYEARLETSGILTPSAGGGFSLQPYTNGSQYTFRTWDRAGTKWPKARDAPPGSYPVHVHPFKPGDGYKSSLNGGSVQYGSGPGPGDRPALKELGYAVGIILDKENIVFYDNFGKEVGLIQRDALAVAR